MIKTILLKLFGIKFSGYEYWVRIDHINIPEEFARTRIGSQKYLQKNQYFSRNGEFESKIVLDRNFTLLDGYSSYLIAKRNDIGKVPVYFK